ncbi:hypothetical protein [Rhizorhapis suberifaciens]|uniref:DUF1214 domain-containing protein n=1 Tax=Rhizorhapis suberifaciens TaxID=13656 RepID=A0A840HZS8_9SPHN|nr:hypothetical protein [Rhizorhapis suberifaciens]MBB4642916.1 hypothetical protein [Rhizorhapis suberifaciens]
MNEIDNMRGVDQDAQTSPLATERQYEIEATAGAILKTPEMQKAMEEARQLLLKLSWANSETAHQTLQEVVSECAGYALLSAASTDFENPGLVWIQTPRKEWMGHSVTGSRFCFDNPDNIYRYVFIDDASTYVLDTKPTGPTGRFSVAIYVALTGAEVESWAVWERTVDAADEERIITDSEGASRITIGPEDPKDGSLHLKSQGGVFVIIREALNDWHTQRPRAMSFRKVAGPPSRVLTFDDRVAIAARYMMFGAQTIAQFEQLYASIPVNDFGAALMRGHATKPSMITQGRYHLADDEALIVNLLPQAAEYMSFSVTSPWLISRNAHSKAGSRTARQSHQNADGTYTYIVSRRDPGVANWMDTDGLVEGCMAIRWEGMHAPVADPNDAIKDTKLVKLDAVRSKLPADFPSVGPAERSAELASRRLDYGSRCGMDCKFAGD